MMLHKIGYTNSKLYHVNTSSVNRGKKLKSATKNQLLATERKDSESHKYVKKGLDEPIKSYGA